jgi:hypothetical protein
LDCFASPIALGDFFTHTYRVKTELEAVSRDLSARVARVVRLGSGTIVDIEESEAQLHSSGLVNVSVGNAAFSVFLQDLKDRADRVSDDAT